MKERRRHVRTKPDPSLPARAVRGIDALLKESLEVIDISVGGMALVAPNIATGAKMKLTLTLGSEIEHLVDVEVRWAAAGNIGVSFLDPPAAAAHAIQKYVSELLERGAAV